LGKDVCCYEHIANFAKPFGNLLKYNCL